MRGALSVDGRSQAEPVAVEPSTSADGMLVECRLELCAESIEPSSTWAQLHAACILTIAYLMPGSGAHAGGSNSRISSFGPSHAQTKPPASRTGKDFCLSDFISAAPSGSAAISRMLPSTSNFQP